MRDRDRPSSLDEAPLEDRFPIRNVVLFCDRGCGTEVSGDIRADTAEQAYEGLRKIAVAEHGWLVTDVEDVCPGCQVSPPVDPPTDRPPFSNGTEGDAWTSRWCSRCVKDDGDTVFCELLTTALLGQTPAEWVPDQPLRLGYQYTCTDFESRKDAST